MTYLDTHVTAWLYSGLIDILSSRARALINETDVFISPMVVLELQYLFEIDRITQPPQTVVAGLSGSIGLRVCEKSFSQIATRAGRFSWTRDPFDRIIVAHAALDDDLLVTRDQSILKHFQRAVW